MANRLIYASLGMPGFGEMTGGRRVPYRHVEMLTRHGYDAVIWNFEEFYPSWFESTAPVITGTHIDLDESDILVVSALPVAFGMDDPAPGCRKALLNQGCFHIFENGGPDNYSRWHPLPIMWTVSKTSWDLCSRMRARLPASSFHHIPQVIDTDLFKPSSSRGRTIAWMPRKRPWEANALFKLFSDDERFSGVTFKSLDEIREHEVAAELASTSIFIALPTTNSEGFGLPPAEALAAGCVVVGHHAGGGKEIFECPGAYAVDDPDVLGIVEQVAVLLGEEPSEDERLVYRNWIKDRYNESRQLEAIINSVKTAEETPAKGGRAVHPLAMPVNSGGQSLAEFLRQKSG